MFLVSLCSYTQTHTHTHTHIQTMEDHVSGFLVLTHTHTHISYYLPTKSMEQYSLFNSQIGDVAWPLNIDLSGLLLPANICHYLLYIQ
jgi:hypothetical protein